jgi:hypothetical protein
MCHVVFINDDIGRLDITVDHTLLVGVMQSVSNLRYPNAGLLWGKAALPVMIMERLTFDKGHRQVNHPLIFTIMIDGDNMGVAQARNHSTLAPEAQHKPTIAADGWRQHFKRDDCAGLRVFGPKYGGHPTLTYLLNQQELIKFFADKTGQRITP